MSQFLFKHWISNGTDQPFYARRAFTLSADAKKAAVRVCGLGQFNLYVNGRKVSDHLLDPAWTDYNKLVLYSDFDITDLLQTGENVIAAEVGNGWYIMEKRDGCYSFRFPSFMPPNPNDYRPFAEELVLALDLEAELADGTCCRLAADESWLTADHPVVFSNVYGSEWMDGTRRIRGWNEVGCTEGSWRPAVLADRTSIPRGRLAVQTIPPVREIALYSGNCIGHVQGRDIYDFSQNASGMLSFDVKGRAGSQVLLYPAEKLDAEGNVDQMAKNWININVCEKYTIGQDDTWEHFEMTFTYCGCRYVAVAGADRENIRDLKLHAISSMGERAGSFDCDDKRFLQIYDLVEKAVEANMMGVHTDCPTIERFAWQEQNHLMAPSILYMKSARLHWEKFLTDTRLSQHRQEDHFYDLAGRPYYPGEGLIPSQAPCYIPNVLPVPGMGDFYDVIGWGSSLILAAKWHYLFYGDLSVIRDNYDASCRYLKHMLGRVNEEGFIHHGLGDWGNPQGMYARENTETAFLYADAVTLAEFAGLLDRREDRERFLCQAEAIRKNYNEKLLVQKPGSGRYCYRLWDRKDALVTTPAAQAMPLFWGMVPEERKADIVEELRDTVQAAGSFCCGEISQPYIIQTMCRYGMNDLICKVILRREHPSYYAFVLAGETTLGEYWEENPRSHCHTMLGHIAEWYYNGIAGILPLKPGFREVLIRPYLPDSMQWMTCTYRSVSGDITVSLRRGEEGISLQVQAADGIEVSIDRTNLEG